VAPAENRKWQTNKSRLACLTSVLKCDPELALNCHALQPCYHFEPCHGEPRDTFVTAAALTPWSIFSCMSAQKRRHPTIPIPPLPKFTLPLPSSSAQQGNYHVPALNSPLAPLSGKGFMQTQDYSRWPPDELFARMGVSEVKGVHARLRYDAQIRSTMQI
jgi:hypothetical protein